MYIKNIGLCLQTIENTCDSCWGRVADVNLFTVRHCDVKCNLGLM